MTRPRNGDLAELQVFVVQLGAAMNAAGEPVYEVQQRLTRVAQAYGAHSARISAFPTYLMVTMGRGEPATLELTMPLATETRLDQIAALEHLTQEAERGEVDPGDGLRRLSDIRELPHRFSPVQSVLGYSVLTLGICLILHPALRDVAAAAVFGAFVGFLRSLGKHQSSWQIIMPVAAAFSVSAVSAFAVKQELAGPGLRAMVASLVVFLPGAALTTAVLELAAGQMVSGSSRLVTGIVQLAMLAFGILAGIAMVGIPSAHVLSESAVSLGPWAPWLGVLVFAVGITVAHSAPPRSFPALVLVLYAAWSAQFVGNKIFGGYVSAFVGAVVMTAAAFWVSRLPSAMPPHAAFLPGFWLLVPGALGLIGLTEWAGDPTAAGTQDLVATTISIFAVAFGVLCGTLVLEGGVATSRLVGSVSKSMTARSHWLNRIRRRPRDHGPPESEDGGGPRSQ